MEESTLLTIKDFAKFTGAAQSTLRYYDEIGLLTPAKRGDENNYRYYTPPQIISLKFINVLIELGIPLSSIKEMTSERSPEKVMDILNKQEVILNRRLDELRKAFSIIHTLRGNIQNGLFANKLMNKGVCIKVEKFEEVFYIKGPRTGENFKNDSTFFEGFIRFCDSASENRINLKYPIGGYYDDFDSFKTTAGRPDCFISLDPLGNCKNPAGYYLVGYERGPYGAFGDIAEKMQSYASEKGLVFKGPVCVVYVFDEISISDPNEYLSKIAVRVAKKKII
jgi:DNA-binding transcriptional MerR regulator/effector-binding domain-containing protein